MWAQDAGIKGRERNVSHFNPLQLWDMFPMTAMMDKVRSIKTYRRDDPGRYALEIEGVSGGCVDTRAVKV